jgi:transcriptional regulator with XRE-family HTH domain
MLKERLVELRKRSGLTQLDIADYLKITRQAYCFYESGKREMNFASLCLLADFYNVTTDFLLGREKIEHETFSADEIKIISGYRLLDGRGKNAVKATINTESHFKKTFSKRA